MTKIWLLGSGSGSRAQKCDKNMKIIWIKCENNVKLWNHIIFTSFSYYFQIIFTFLGPGSAPQNVKIICKIIPFPKFTWFSYFIHIIFIFLSHFWARDPDPGPKSHIFVIFLVIFCSYDFHIFCENLVFRPVHTDNLYKHIFWLTSKLAAAKKTSPGLGS